MKKTVLSVVLGCLMALNVFAEGTESFDKCSYKTSVGTYNYTGDNGEAWQICGTTDVKISGTRGAVLYAYQTGGNLITGHFSADQLSQGVGVVTFKAKAAFGNTSGVQWSNTRSFVVTVGGVSQTVTQSMPNTSTTVTYSAEFNLTSAQLSATTTLTIKVVGVVSGEPAFVVDDVAWTSYSGKTDTPTMTVDAYQDVNSGVYWGNDIRASFASTTEKATFYYTLNGSTPTQSSDKYTTPVQLPLDATTTVKILAVTTEKGESEIATYTVTTAKGTINANDCSVLQLNERWTNTNVPKLQNIAKGTTTSGTPYLYGNKNSEVITEAYLCPQTFSFYAGGNSSTTLTVAYQKGDYEVTSGVYTWIADGDWVTVKSLSRNAGNMTRYDIELPATLKSELARIKIASSNYVYLDDITTVTPDAEQVEMPTFSQKGGDVYENTVITLTCPTGATLHYSVNNGTEQTATANVQITITRAMTISAYATCSGKHTSYIVKETYNLPTTKRPIITPADGTELKLNDVITIASATDGATIVYRVNEGVEQEMVTPVEIMVAEKIDSVWAYCKYDGLLTSDTVIYRYTTAKTQKPSINTTNFNVPSGTEVQIYSEGSSTIHYRIDNGEWQTASVSKYVTIENSCKLEVYATKTNYLPSDTAVWNFVVTKGQLAAPTADVESGTLLAANSQVTISGAEGATLHYRQDDGNWQTTANSSVTLTITATTTIEAYVSQQDYTDSETATFSYIVAKGKVATPHVTSGDEREVASGTQISITCATPNATLYCKINDEAWKQWPSKTFTYQIIEKTTILVYATCADYFDSDTLEVTYTVSSSATAIESTLATTPVIWAAQRTIVVENAENQNVTIYNLLGAQLYQQEIESISERFVVPTQGIYLVRIADRTYKVLISK